MGIDGARASRIGGHTMNESGPVELLKYADRVLTGTGIAAADIRIVVASAAADAATMALRAGWECASNALILVDGDER
ncbi:hypothetical protein A3L23_05025 (plasmid) [Rhodococcoides fascians D188]|nr:hypothetical protein A3L23_05025 [Rhodococcus fascians D188]